MSNILTFSHGQVTLNDEQYKVVTSPISENQRILASAGSGKTTTITARIAYLIEKYNIDPSTIILVTFSRAASDEMIHRLYKLVGKINIYAGTFHALSMQILRDNAPKMVGDQPFIDELPYRLVKWLETDGLHWAKRFKIVIVDEFQDINDIQWKFINRFSKANMSIVGDDAQNIYTWRGSSVDFILNFHNNIEKVKDYQLCRNYRSTEAIVTIANSIMRFIPTLECKEKMIAVEPGGTKPEVHFFFRGSDEYDWIVNSLEKCKESKLTFAVISRYNHDLFKIEEKLHLKGIQYNMHTHYNPDNFIEKNITLTTIHASKGLEWDVVFFMNLHDDVFPSRKSDEEIICERRLFYVAITRARKGLYMTYSRHERSLSRFVREIPRPFLKYYNISSFKLSTNEIGVQTMRIEDMIRGFDGADWNNLRVSNNVPVIKIYKTESIYKFGQIFSMPEWVKKYNVRDTWLEMMRLISIRECAIHQNKLDELITPEINETLLTIRIYKEDIEFWEKYEAEMEHLVHTFLKHTINMPAIEYHQLDEYVKTKLRHLNWTIQDNTIALMIISKIRGQLRPLRHRGFDLNEFKFGFVRNSVPTELRPEVLESWQKIIDKNEKTHDILGDIWRIASIKSVIEGRNIPLYQHKIIFRYLFEEDQQNIIKAIEIAIPSWIITQEVPSFNFLFEIKGICPIKFDIITEKCAYYVFFDPFIPSSEDKILLLLKHYAYEKLYDKLLDYVGFINVATGTVIQYEITSTIREQLSKMWLYIREKY